MRYFPLTIASVGETLFSDEIASVTAPGTDGAFTVLAGHEPFVTTLTEGAITVREADGNEQTFETARGVFETDGRSATVLLS